MAIRKGLDRPKRSNRRLVFESLEARELLDGAGILDQVRAQWSDFSLSEDAHVYEIAANELSVENLRNAINNAVATPGDDLIVLHTTGNRNTIAFNAPDQEYAIDLTDKGTLTIVSAGTTPLTINAGGYSRIFNFSSGCFQLGAVTLVAGNSKTDLDGNIAPCALGGAIANSGTAILSHVTIKDCSAAGEFDPNSTYSSFFSKGGAVYNSGSMTVIDSTFSGNTARSSECNKLHSTAYGAGGAIYNDKGALVLRDCMFRNNMAEADLAPYQVLSGDVLTTRYSQQEGCGGAVYSTQGTVTITDCAFLENSAYIAGGVYSERGSLSCSGRTLFKLNTAVYNAGAILATGKNASTTLDRCEFLDNSAGENGGAIASRTQMTIANSLFSGNDAGISGGGLYLDVSSSAQDKPIEIHIINCTVTGNRAGTRSAGAGAGIYFSGMKDSETCAKLYIKNSIVINNKTERSSNEGDDPNIALENGTKEYCFGYSSLTSFNAWRIASGNPEYNPEKSPFQRDYNFETRTQGDYRLVDAALSPDAHPAVGLGNNEWIDLKLFPYDLDGIDRIYDDLIDLGAYESQPSIFDSAFPSGLSVQQGCSLNLSCHGADARGDPYTKYLVDLNGDGCFDLVGSSIWMSWNDLPPPIDNKVSIYVAVENSKRQRSETREITVDILEVPRSISVKQNWFYHEQILKLSLSVFSYGASIQKWTIDWGDGSLPTEYYRWTNSLSTAHYYRQSAETQTFHVTLRLIDSNGRGGEIVYSLGTHTLAGTDALADLPENTLSFAEESSQPLAAPLSLATESERSDSIQKSTPLDCGTTSEPVLACLPNICLRKTSIPLLPLSPLINNRADDAQVGQVSRAVFLRTSEPFKEPFNPQSFIDNVDFLSDDNYDCLVRDDLSLQEKTNDQEKREAVLRCAASGAHVRSKNFAASISARRVAISELNGPAITIILGN